MVIYYYQEAAEITDTVILGEIPLPSITKTFSS